MTLQENLDWLRETLALGNHLPLARWERMNKICEEIAVAVVNATPEDLIRMIPNARIDTLRNGPDFKVWRVQHPASFCTAPDKQHASPTPISNERELSTWPKSASNS